MIVTYPDGERDEVLAISSMDRQFYVTGTKSQIEVLRSKCLTSDPVELSFEATESGEKRTVTVIYQSSQTDMDDKGSSGQAAFFLIGEK